ncbi:MAG: NAD(P)-dependent oxidoreductase [Candidatus Binatia bacterium]
MPVLLVALIPPPSDPSLGSAFYGSLLGEGWTVKGFRGQDDIPDDVAAQVEFVVAPPPAAIDARLITRAPKLRLIQVPGHGVDHIHIEHARAAGVPVATVASSGAEAHTVAEMTILLAGVASRRIIDGDGLVRAGGWGNLGMLQHGVFELAGKTLGIVGFGGIGREVAKRARAFDMRVVYNNAARLEVATEAQLDVEFRDLDALLCESDIVSLHLPLTPQTRGLIGERKLSLMKRQAVLVNTARGALVDAAALAAALRAGRIGAAAIDVFDPEPPPADNPLRQAPNCVLSPHMAGVTAESVMRIVAAALDNCKRVARGEPPHDVQTEPDAR